MFLAGGRSQTAALDIHRSRKPGLGANQGRDVEISNGRKIARIAPISTIFGPNESSRRNLFFEKFSKERIERKDFEKFKNFSKNSEKNARIMYISKLFPRPHISTQDLVMDKKMSMTATMTKATQDNNDADKTKNSATTCRKRKS